MPRKPTELFCLTHRVVYTNWKSRCLASLEKIGVSGRSGLHVLADSRCWLVEGGSSCPSPTEATLTDFQPDWPLSCKPPESRNKGMASKVTVFCKNVAKSWGSHSVYSVFFLCLQGSVHPVLLHLFFFLPLVSQMLSFCSSFLSFCSSFYFYFSY